MQSEPDVATCEERLVAAQLAGDTEELDRLLADDLLYTGLSGELAGKADDLALHRSGRFRITRMALQERHFVEAGSAVVVIALMDTAAELEGHHMAGLLRYTRVWAPRSGAWQLVAAHLCHVPASRSADPAGSPN